jgi:DNA-binding MarR family transcriptional regulator
MPSEQAPFDVVEASLQVWLERWDDPVAASGMAVFAGLLRSYQLLQDEVDVVMRRHGLTFGRYEVLAWLATEPEPNLTLSWISRTLKMPPATLTNVIDHLEGKGLVRRVAHPTDARTTLAAATVKGRHLADRMTQELNSEVYRSIPLSEGSRQALIELLRELRAQGKEFDLDRNEDVIGGLRAKSQRTARS